MDEDENEAVVDQGDANEAAESEEEGQQESSDEIRNRVRREIDAILGLNFEEEMAAEYPVIVIDVE